MTPTTKILRVESPHQAKIFCDLVWEFFDVLRERYPDMAGTIDTYLKEQKVAEELENLLPTYSPPNGACLLGYSGDKAVGTVMLKRHGKNDCELNRMYVRSEARGIGLGRALCVATVVQAREIGFDVIYLDALYRHREALPLYESIGFETYTDPSAFEADDERVIHMKMQLKG